MKVKILLLICSLSMLFFGCNSKEICELKNKNSLLTNENADLKNQIQELSKSITELETENSDLKVQLKEIKSKNNSARDSSGKITSLNKLLEDNSKYKVHDLLYTLNFEYGGYDTKVYPLPKTENAIYTIQKDDIVDVFKIVHIFEDNENFIAVRVNNDLYGFIKINGNPYYNGNFEIADTIMVDGSETTILKMEKSFTVDEGTFIKELPSETSANLHEITHEEGKNYYKTFYITSDYKWSMVQVGDFTGWVPSDCLSVDRGGPTLNTPEEFIYFDLIGGNEI